MEQPDQEPPETEAPPQHNTSKTCTWKRTLKASLETKEKLQTFHANPYIYCVLLSCDLEKYFKPINFIAVDCSGLLMSADTLTATSSETNHMQISMSVSAVEPLLPMEKLIVYEPMILRLYGYVISKFMNAFLLVVLFSF